MRRLALQTVMAVALGAFLTGSASAISIGIVPSSTSIAVGDPLTVEVVVSDLGGQVVSAYDLDILFDDSVLQANFVSFTTALGSIGSGQAFVDANLPAPGVLDIASVSLLSDAQLAAIQGDPVTLAVIGFTGLADGATAIGFSFDEFNDVKGLRNQVLDLDVVPTRVTVGEGPGEAVPEPTSALVFGIGSLLVASAIRRRRQA